LLQIFETVFDAHGVMLRRQTLGVIFLHRLTAARFLDVHLPYEFKNGRTGYDCAGDYWWGCYGDAEIRRYTIEGDLPMVALAARATADGQPELDRVG